MHRNHPIALLRAHWIFLNILEDERLEAERRCEEIEYGGFFANPEVYSSVKGLEKRDGIQISYDTSEYDRKLDAGYRGIVMNKPRSTDTAELVKRKRAEQAARATDQSPRTPEPQVTPEDLLETDLDLIVERG